MLGVVHSAAGAWLSKAARNRRQAILLGIVSHVVVDFLGHEEPFDEDGSPRLAVLLPDGGLTVIALVWLGAKRGWLSPGLLASTASILPDAEHLLPLSRASHKKLFPSHRFEGLLHSKIGSKPSLNVQFLLGGLLWLLLALRERGEPDYEPLAGECRVKQGLSPHPSFEELGLSGKFGIVRSL